VQDGISAALNQLGLGRAPDVPAPNQEVKVSPKEILEEWPYYVDPKGDRSKRLPWIETIRDPETGVLIKAKMIIPPGMFGRRMRPEATPKTGETEQMTIARLIKAGRQAMLDQLAKDQGVEEMDVRTRLGFLECTKKLAAKGVPEEEIWTAIEEGSRLVVARKEGKIPDTVDMAGKGIQVAKNWIKSTKAWVDEYFGTFKPAKRPSPRGEGTETRTNARAILRRLADTLGPETSLLEIMKEKVKLTKFFHDEVHSPKGKISTRKRNWKELVEFFDYVANEMERPSLNPKIHGGCPQGIRGKVKAPKPPIIQKFLDLVEDEIPTFLPMATMMVFFARPQTAHAILENLRNYLKDEWIEFPLSVEKVGSKFDHTVKLRTSPLLWFARDPRWKDPRCTDFRPCDKNGQPYSYVHVEDTLGKYMKKAGWDGDLPKEYLRKSFASAQIAVGNNLEDVIWELGHANLGMLVRYNALWTKAEGLAFFLIVPRGTKIKPNKGFWLPVKSPRRGLYAAAASDYPRRHMPSK
jgi:hypothetical protein